jgi:hypothetical protein
LPSTATSQDRRLPGALVSGRVTDAVNGQPVVGAAVVVEGTGQFALTDSTGRYSVAGVPPGPQVLRIESLGYALSRVPLTVPLSGVLVQDVEVAPSALEVEGITVTADPSGRARGELGTASVIDKEAIDLQTAPSLAKILELSPGVPLQPPGLDNLQTIPLRAVPTASGGVSGGGSVSTDLASYGTLIVLDGVPLSNNANLQTTGPRGEISAPTSVGGGVDLRTIPATTLERVEVIRGLPSARYGDLTQGTIVVDTRAGAVDPILLGRYDGRTLELTTVGGTNLGLHQEATLNFDYATTAIAPGTSQSAYSRFTTQLAHRVRFGLAQTAVLDSRLSYSLNYENHPERPEVAPGAASWTRDHNVRLNERARFALGAEAWLEATASLSYTDQNSYVQSLRNRGAMPFTNRLTEGRQEGHYVGGPYIAKVSIDGSPWLLYGRLEAGQPGEWLGLAHNLLGGLELRREWNTGPGYEFDIEFPPQVNFNGVNGFDRPRRYDDVPPLATSALYIDDRLSRRLFGDMLLNLQLGLRLDVLHEGGGFFSGVRDAFLQPRINVELGPVQWLRLRGAWGRAAKVPSLGRLYPAPQYYDVVNVNWYANDPAERLAVLTTYMLDPVNPDLGFAKATMAELGVEFGIGARSAIQIVGFKKDRIDSGFGYDLQPTSLLRDHYQLSDSTLGTGRPPEIIEPASYADTVPVLLYRPANNQTMKSEGIEVTAFLPELRAIRTRFEVQGAYYRTDILNTGIDFGSASRFSDFQLSENIARAPYWMSPLRIGERALMTYRGIFHEPRLGFVVSATVQHALWDTRESVAATDTLAFEGYISRDGSLTPVPESERGNPEYADLRVQRMAGTSDRARAPSDWFLSFQVAKTLPMGGRLSFYAFNALDRVGIYGERGVASRIFSPTRFGFELTVPARAIFQPIYEALR